MEVMQSDSDRSVFESFVQIFRLMLLSTRCPLRFFYKITPTHILLQQTDPSQHECRSISRFPRVQKATKSTHSLQQNQETKHTDHESQARSQLLRSTFNNLARSRGPLRYCHTGSGVRTCRGRQAQYYSRRTRARRWRGRIADRCTR
jgi:hypothetical protein